MKTAQEYIHSLEGLSRNLYILGEKVDDPLHHPILKPSLNALAKTYEIAQEPTYSVVSQSTALPASTITPKIW